MRGAFEVRLTRNAQKDLEDLEAFYDQVVEDLLALEQDPHKGHTLTGSLKGARALEFSLPGGAYRAVYVVEERERVCLVFILGPHEGIYQKAERRIRAVRRRPQ